MLFSRTTTSILSVAKSSSLKLFLFNNNSGYKITRTIATSSTSPLNLNCRSTNNKTDLLLSISRNYATNISSNSSSSSEKDDRRKQQLKSEYFSQSQSYSSKKSRKNAILYITSGLILMIGASYAAVPLYKMFCEAQGLELSTEFKYNPVEQLKQKLNSMRRVEERVIKVKFVASTSSDLLWKFEPSQDEITVAPGETALAFFKAKNNTDRSIVGIATYTILPFEAALYFTKIQCFCFEEQRLEPHCLLYTSRRLEPHEEVDMPVFFYIDEEYAKDPKLETINEICLSYTFFESKGNNY